MIVNLRSTPGTYVVPESLQGDQWKDAYTGAETSVPGQLALQPYQYLVYKKR